MHLHKIEDTLCDPGCQNRTGEHNEKQQKDEMKTKQYEKQAMSATEQNTVTKHDWNFRELCKTSFKNESILAHSYKTVRKVSLSSFIITFSTAPHI